jgi:flagellar hook-length control protein FliK
MDVNLSSIGILFAGTTGSGSIQPEPITIKTGRCYGATVDDLRYADSYQADETDNNRGNSRDGLAESSPPDFGRELRQESTRRAPPDNIAEIKPLKTPWQNDGTIEAAAQLPLLADIPALNLSPSVGAQESMKAAAALQTGTPPRLPGGSQERGLKLSKDCQPTDNAKWTALKPTLSGVSGSVSAGLKEQAGVANASKEAALSAQEMQCRKFQSKSPELTARPASDQSTAVVACSVERGADRKKLNAKPYPLNADQRTAESPGKPQLAAIQSETRSAQTKTGSSSESKGKPAANLDRLYSFHTSQTVLSEQSSTPSQTTRVANDAPPGNAAGSISQQIAVSIEGSLRQRDTNLTIYLNPPELGKVLVRFQQQQDQITILLEASKPETRREIELTLPQIMRSLQDSGVQIRRLEVSAPSGSDELEQQPDTGTQGQDNGEMTQHHFTGESDSDLDWIGVPRSSTNDEDSFHEWLTSTVKDRHQDDFAPPLVFTGGSINMLI